MMIASRTRRISRFVRENPAKKHEWTSKFFVPSKLSRRRFGSNARKGEAHDTGPGTRQGPNMAAARIIDTNVICRVHR
jgi:hypothetical protein